MRCTNTPTQATTSPGFTSYLRTRAGMFTLCEDTENAHSHAHVSRGDGWKVQKEESWRGDRRREINAGKEID